MSCEGQQSTEGTSNSTPSMTEAQCDCLVCQSLKAVRDTPIEIRLGVGKPELNFSLIIDGYTLKILAGASETEPALAIMGAFLTRHGLISANDN